MKQIMSFVPVDIVPYHTGIICAQKSNIKDSGTKWKFVACDFEEKKAFKVTKDTYLQYKFGKAYQQVVRQLVDVTMCVSTKMPHNQILITYANGEVGLFNKSGALTWSDQLIYNDVPLSHAVADGNDFWCIAKDYNAILQYSLEEKRMVYRIGSPDSDTFISPTHIWKWENTIYVSSPKSKQIKTVNKDLLNVETLYTFKESVYKFFKTDTYELVVLSSGIYLL